VTLVTLIPLKSDDLGVIRVLALLGFLVLMTVLILLLVLLVSWFVHGETPSTLVDDLGCRNIAGKDYRSQVLKPLEKKHTRMKAMRIA